MKIRVRPSNDGIRIGENTQNQLIVLKPNTFAVAKINVRNIKNKLAIPFSIFLPPCKIKSTQQSSSAICLISSIVRTSDVQTL